MRLVAFLVCSCALAQTWQMQESGTTASLRGLSVVSDSVVWASGAKGTVLRTVDQGAAWVSVGPAGAADLDFRDIQAFSANEAIAMSAGEGRLSRLYRTTDGGATWTLLKSNGPEGFWDAFGMWDATHGILLGDPVDGRFTILTTSDGRTWSELQGPKAEKNEAAFAASGTALITRGTREAWFATGGTGGGRIFHTEDAGRTWSVTKVTRPVTETGGIYSLAFCGKDGFAVGGDYANPNDVATHAWISADNGKTWKVAAAAPRGYRSAVDCGVAVGTSGADAWNGSQWRSLGDMPLHAAAHGPQTVWAVGPEGRIALLAGR